MRLFLVYLFSLLTPAFIKKMYYKDYNYYFQISNSNLFSLLFFLKKHSTCQYKSLIDIIISDYPAKKYRFCINYFILSFTYNARANIIIRNREVNGLISIINLYNSAGWAEREAWDMFGINFYHHSDLRRILTDYGFSGFPLRKDFPLTGFVEISYSQKQKRLVYNRVVLSQEYRNFWFEHYTSYWGFQKFNLHDILLVVLTIRIPEPKDAKQRKFVAIAMVEYAVWRDTFDKKKK